MRGMWRYLICILAVASRTSFAQANDPSLAFRLRGKLELASDEAVRLDTLRLGCWPDTVFVWGRPSGMHGVGDPRPSLVAAVVNQQGVIFTSKWDDLARLWEWLGAGKRTQYPRTGADEELECMLQLLHGSAIASSGRILRSNAGPEASDLTFNDQDRKRLRAIAPPAIQLSRGRRIIRLFENQCGVSRVRIVVEVIGTVTVDRVSIARPHFHC